MRKPQPTMTLPSRPRYRLSEAELSNLITACNTSTMRSAPGWRTTLDALAVKLEAMRALVEMKNGGG